MGILANLGIPILFYISPGAEAHPGQKQDMTKKRIVVFCGIGVLLALVAFEAARFLDGKTEQRYTEERYIFDKNFRADKTHTDVSNNTYLFRGTVTAETLHFFRSLERRFAV